MVDLHTHTIFSDGELLPAELVRRCDVNGLKYVAITDHAGPSNMASLLEAAQAAAEALNPVLGCRIIPGVELTHLPPRLIPEMAVKARELGAKWVVVHGETPVEPVTPGTNRAALDGPVDLLAHPGLITEEEAVMAAERGVALELTSRGGHCLGNGRVAALARDVGARLLISSDAHHPRDLMTADLARAVALGAGLSEEEFEAVRDQGLRLARTALAD